MYINLHTHVRADITGNLCEQNILNTVSALNFYLYMIWFKYYLLDYIYFLYVQSETTQAD